MVTEQAKPKDWRQNLYSYLNSIKTKLVFSFLIITLTPLIYISYAMLNNASDSLLNVIVNNSLAHARKASIDFNGFIDHQFEIVQLLLNSDSALDKDAEGLTKILVEHDKRYFSIENITVIDDSGNVFACSSEKPFSGKIDFVKAVSQLHERKFILQSARREGDQNTVVLVSGISDRSGEIYSLLVVELNLLQLSGIISENVVGNSSRIYLLNESNQVVFSIPEGLPTNDLSLMKTKLDNHEYGVFAIAESNSQKSLLAAYIPAVGSGWKILLAQDQQEVYSLVEIFRKNLYWILFFTALVAIVIALLISQNIALPILKVTHGANELAAGKYDVRINVKNTDEVGQLASNFNFMADSLAEKMKELRYAYDELKKRAATIEEKNVALDRKVFEIGVLYKIGQAMVEVGIDFEKLLDVIIDQAIEAANAQRGSLMLLDDNQELLELQRVRIWDDKDAKTVAITDFERNIHIKPGEGVAGKVLQSGEMLTINDPDNDPDFKQYDNEKNRVNQLVCVPLKVKNVTFGVINIVNRKNNNDFEKRDTDLLETMANQAALVLDNTKLFKLAITDGLTGLFLVRHFKIKLNEEAKRARRYKSIFSIIFFDIDHFKKFNDTYGHQVGDEVLKQVSVIFKNSLREDIDVPARYGGEEMIALLPETDAQGAYIVAERLREAIEIHEFSGHDSPLRVTISIGIAEFPLHDTESLGLIRKADTALYQCKKNGRNQTSIYSDAMGVVSEK